VYIEKPAVNLREELASLRNQGGYQEQQFYFDGLVTNGTFDADTDWTKGTGWTIGSGVASKTGADTNIDNTGYVTRIPTNAVVRFEFTISGYVGGSIRPVLAGGNANAGTFQSGNGTYSEFITNSGSNSYARFQTSGFEGSIDNVSVFETDGTDVVHKMPKGWKPKDVFEDGLLQREGAAYDYEVVYDGFDYYVKPAVAPSATTQTCVIGVKA